jgi:hypothetical protein
MCFGCLLVCEPFQTRMHAHYAWDVQLMVWVEVCLFRPMVYIVCLSTDGPLALPWRDTKTYGSASTYTCEVSEKGVKIRYLVAFLLIWSRKQSHGAPCYTSDLCSPREFCRHRHDMKISGNNKTSRRMKHKRKSWISQSRYERLPGRARAKGNCLDFFTWWRSFLSRKISIFTKNGLELRERKIYQDLRV